MRNWDLYIIPNHEVKNKKFNPKTIDELKENYKSIPAKVPGNFELDMLEAGLIEDPFYGTNVLKMQELENLHLFYTTVFDNLENREENSKTYLVFEGIDTIADIFLNGIFLGHVDNMFIAHEFLVEEYLREKNNELLVHIYPATIEARNHELTPLNFALRYNYASLRIRKAASMFGWDIMPRIVSGGIWKEVKLVRKKSERIEDIYIYTLSVSPESSTAYIWAFYNIETDADLIKDLVIKVKGECKDSTFEMSQRLFHTYGAMSILVDNARLWYPKNAGEPNLYNTTVSLYRGDVLVDEKKLKIGIRTVELVRTSTTDESGSGEFVFKINGKKIFCMGTNWVPLDAFHSNDINRLPKALELMDDIGYNMVRCWGGNVYEGHAFFEFCDEKGIMVWQDFAMGCGVYSQDEEFQKKIEKEAAYIVKKLRNHPSLVLWAGDNECDLFQVIHNNIADPNDNIITRKTLKEVCRIHDFAQPYLPSSPYIEKHAFESQKPLSEDHLWGPRDYFKGSFYKNSLCHFASETGYHGCPSPLSLKKFIPEDKLWPIFEEDGSTVPEWQVHASCMETEMGVEFSYRIGLMADQVKTLFGSLPDDINTFAYMSQISQAEAKKYFIERFRISKWRRTGILWWNLLDGWPQISDAVVDYYFVKKLAYHYINRSQAPLCLMCDEPEKNMLSLYAVNDTQDDAFLKYAVTRFSDNLVVAKGIFNAQKDSSCLVCQIPITENEKDFYYIEWEDSMGEKHFNHYFTNIIDIDFDMYMSALRHYNMDQFAQFSEG